MKKITPVSFSIGLLIAVITIYSCSKGGGTTPPPSNPCAGVTVSVTGTTTNPTTPAASDGTITVSATGGSGFTFSINGGAFQSSGTFSGLAAGSYSVTAKNGSGCSGAASFTITAPNPCAGITIAVTGTVTNPTAPGATNGSIAASATGSANFTFSINGSAFQPSGTFNSLAAGAYTITAKDGNGCTGAASFTLTAPNPCAGITITVTGTVTNPTSQAASDGSIVASASGSTNFTFSINGGTFQALGTFNNLVAGAYTVTAKDGNGCTGSASFTLTAPNPCAGVTITVSNTIAGNIPCGPATGMITASAVGGTGPYMFNINGGTFQVSNIFSGLGPASYTIGARDANSCNGSTAATVSNLPAGPLFLDVKAVLQANCVSCHNSSQAEGGMNWTIDCNIVTNKARIKARAVDGTPSAMPPSGLLPASERQKITSWINAGGLFTN